MQRRERQAGRRQEPDGSLAPFGAVYLALLGLGTVGALAVYLLAFVPGASGARLDAMKAALLVVAGSGAGAGLCVRYRTQQAGEARSALDHADSRRDQDKLFTERYTTAAAQLGDTAAAVRLAGVHALARVADDSERDRPTCLNVLCAYLRMPYDPDDSQTEPAERQVRTTAQTAIAERLRPDHPGFWHKARIDLTDAHLIDLDFRRITVGEFKADRARFTGTAQFDKATFTGDVRFSEATFTGTAWFSEARFVGDAWFDKATFTGDAWFSFTTFPGDAWFSEATFTGDAWFSKARFTGDAGFSEARFTRDAGFGGATFTGHAWFDDATFTGNAVFPGATFPRGCPPVWPEGFDEPAGIEWADPPANTSAEVGSPGSRPA